MRVRITDELTHGEWNTAGFGPPIAVLADVELPPVERYRDLFRRARGQRDPNESDESAQRSFDSGFGHGGVNEDDG